MLSANFFASVGHTFSGLAGGLFSFYSVALAMLSFILKIMHRRWGRLGNYGIFY